MSLLYIILSFIALGLVSLYIHDKFQKKHTILRNYPIIGWGRYFAEELRKKIQQYFIEDDLNGKPFSKLVRSIVYQRAKGDRETVPFGTQLDLYKQGSEFVEHAMFPNPNNNYDIQNDRVTIGHGSKSYQLSRLNSSAMSFGALSSRAIESISKGAENGLFAVNTGEGGISKYHLKYNTDLIWQIGTGYFGCRTVDGNFDIDKFKSSANNDKVKMIEIKLSQGAKPGHGGILPAAKNTPEIAKIRGLEAYTDVHSPANHKAFSNLEEMFTFIYQLKEVTGNKPIGFKICFGSYNQIDKITRFMVDNNVYPDFITVDGAEGGTGAAPLEFSNNMGLPLYDELTHLDKKLKEFNIRDKVKILASGKIATSFDIIKAIACGADAVNMARGFMFALGCIQALECNSGNCPAGITTHGPKSKGLVVSDKAQRIRNFHINTIKATNEMLLAMGVDSLDSVTPEMIMRRVEEGKIVNLSDIYFS